jgi:hypothetical protein
MAVGCWLLDDRRQPEMVIHRDCCCCGDGRIRFVSRGAAAGRRPALAPGYAVNLWRAAELPFGPGGTRLI